jgi:hypothetical protein
VDSFSQRDQAGHASDYQREQTHCYQHSEDDEYFPRAGILRYDGGFHNSLSLLCTWNSALQSKVDHIFGDDQRSQDLSV